MPDTLAIKNMDPGDMTPDAHQAQREHTPGPWRVSLGRWTADSPVTGFSIYGPMKDRLIWSDDVTIPNDERRECALATANRADEYALSAFYSPAEIEANARLIAAAPDLLDALHELEILLCEVAPEYAESPATAFARAAIAKATQP